MDAAAKFGDRLGEIMQERGFGAYSLAAKTGISRPTITRYLGGNILPSYKTLVVLCDFFDCSADFLLGAGDYSGVGNFTKSGSFPDRLKEALSLSGVTSYRMGKDLRLSGQTLHAWLSGKSLPGAESLMKIAAYLSCSVDYLLGRAD